MRPSPTDQQSYKVAVIAFDGITPFHLSVPCLVFGTSTDEPTAPAFHTVVCGLTAGPMHTSAGFAITAEHDLSLLDTADIVVMPSWHDDCRSTPAPLLDGLRLAHANGAIVVGLCLGAFPLSEAGLLDGKTATTHWGFTQLLAARHAKVRVDQDVLYVDEGSILTSAGVAAGLDCCLHLLRRLCGAEVANKVARKILVAPHRDGGQAQFIERPLPVSHSDERFSQVIEWMGKHLQDEHDIDTLAARAAMSRRNFTRRFRVASGTSVKQWLLNQRVMHAQRLLETSMISIELVAHEAGFGTALSMRQHFRSALKTTPSAYRALFQAPVKVA